MITTDLRRAIEDNDYEAMTARVRSPMLEAARDSVLAFLSAPPFEDGKPVNKARLEWLAAQYVETDEAPR